MGNRRQKTSQWNKPYYHNKLTSNPDERGFYPVAAGTAWGLAHTKSVLIRHGMKSRPAYQYRAAANDARAEFERRAANLTGLTVEWYMITLAGSVMASQFLSGSKFDWDRLRAAVLESIAAKGRRGEYR